MSRLKHYIVYGNVDEAAYKNNLGFIEMSQFYQQASDKDIKKMEAIIKAEDWEGFKKMIDKTLKVELK
jgi:hypothetical protein